MHTPLQVGAAYRFPAGYDGTGQAVALIELGGGYAESTLTQYFQSIGVTVGQQMSAALAGKESVDAALKASQVAADREMKKAGYYK